MKNILIADTHTDSYRGIGVHTNQLLRHLEKSKKYKVVIGNPDKLDLSDYDLIHYQKYNPYLSKFKKMPKKLKVVVTIHDLIYLIYPKHYPSGLRGKLNFIKSKKFLGDCDAIITISETSKKDIVRFLGVNSEKVHVIRLAAPDFYKPINDIKRLEKTRVKFALPHEFALYVGDVNYNKNLLVLAKACKLSNIKLVMVGKSLKEENVNLKHPELREFKKFLELYKDDKDILRLGFVENSELVDIYNLADFYISTARYEGFDLNCLQAFKCKLPVIASKIQVHKEILEDGCLYAKTDSPEDFADKINSIQTNKKLRNELSEKGLKIQARYSWEKVTRETIDVYEKILE